MATAAEINEVRRNTNEPNEDLFSDADLADLIDGSSVERASAVVWERKAAVWSDQVSTSEAGASRSLSDLNRNAREMAALWNTKADKTDSLEVVSAPMTRRIVRTSP